MEQTTKKRTKAPARNWKFTHPLSQDELREIPIHAPLSIKQETFLNDTEHDVIVFGGSAGAGKTQLTLLKILCGAMWDKNYVASISRFSQKQIKMPGGMWATGTNMLTPLGVAPNRTELSWTFPSGSEVKSHHLDNNQSDYQGAQLTLAVVDEAQQCREDDVWYLTSRLRTKSEQKTQLVLTCNPDVNSFLCSWLVKAGYLDETGLPREDMDGKTTLMLQIGGRFEFYKTRKEIEELYGKEQASFAQKFVFYAANVYSNPYIRKFQPEYVHRLENLPAVERSRLLLGNWFAKEEGVGYVKEENFNKCQLSDIPLSLTSVRAWDLAGTKPHPANRDPDWTRGVLCSYDKETTNFYIKNLKSMRDNSAAVQNLIETTALQDGRGVYCSIPVDSGAAGRTVADQKKSRLMSMGIKTLLEPARASKLVRAEGFLRAVQEGKVYVVDGALSKEDFKEIENFDGVKNNGLHDDLIDALASAFNTLVSGNLIPTIRIGGANGPHYKTRLGGSTLLH